LLNYSDFKYILNLNKIQLARDYFIRTLCFVTAKFIKTRILIHYNFN
jgi:hypothetical protein